MIFNTYGVFVRSDSDLFARHASILDPKAQKGAKIRPRFNYVQQSLSMTATIWCLAAQDIRKMFLLLKVNLPITSIGAFWSFYVLIGILAVDLHLLSPKDPRQILFGALFLAFSLTMP